MRDTSVMSQNEMLSFFRTGELVMKVNNDLTEFVRTMSFLLMEDLKIMGKFGRGSYTALPDDVLEFRQRLFQTDAELSDMVKTVYSMLEEAGGLLISDAKGAFVLLRQLMVRLSSLFFVFSFLFLFLFSFIFVYLSLT